MSAMTRRLHFPAHSKGRSGQRQRHGDVQTARPHRDPPSTSDMSEIWAQADSCPTPNRRGWPTVKDRLAARNKNAFPDPCADVSFDLCMSPLGCADTTL